MGKEKNQQVHSNEIEMLRDDITSLRRTIGGYITCVSKQRREIEALKSELEIAKQPSNELSLKCSGLEEERNEHIKRIRSLSEEVAELSIKLQESKRTCTFYKENYEYFKNAPWYKRIFMK